MQLFSQHNIIRVFETEALCMYSNFVRCIFITENLGATSWYIRHNTANDDYDQPTHPRSLIRVFDRFPIGSQESNVSSGGKQLRF